MIVLAGFAVVLGAVLAGFTMAGGHVGALLHLSELVTIGGAAMGALIVMSTKSVLINLVKGIVQCIKGSPYSKAMYRELFKTLYDLLQLARRDGLMALEVHVNEPESSKIFSKYPRIAKDHHTTEFICNALSPVIEGTAKPNQLAGMLEAEIQLKEAEHHVPLNVLTKTADALPGFGIVAAVLGIVITMEAIDGPVEEIGHKVGAALVGTFLGILLSYGFFGPLAAKMELLGVAEMAFFRTIATVILAFVSDAPPKVAVELGRRGSSTDVRLTRQELDDLFKEAEPV
jgi:chemotaxis protein MotA